MSTNETAQKNILCYGDSNTWGYIPARNGLRFPAHVRWPGVMAQALGDGYRVIEEGLNGRTTVHDDPLSPAVERNGLKTLGTIFDSHRPLDLAIIFLGTNDLKKRFSLPAADIATGVEILVHSARTPAFGPGDGGTPDILVICPPMIWEVAANHGPTFQGGREKSRELREMFQRMAQRANTPVLYAEDVVHTDPADGIHLSAESHALLGQEIAKWVRDRKT